MIRQVTRIFEAKDIFLKSYNVHVLRPIGYNAEILNFDPFVLLDDFKGKEPNGFPDHAHRGFEIITDILSGTLTHENFNGFSTVNCSGGMQYMIAGKGVVHCEMPLGDQECRVLQLWINLPKNLKTLTPNYKQLNAEQIPCGSREGVQVKVLVGEAMSMESPIHTQTPCMYLEFKLEKKASFKQSIPSGWNVFAYIIEGECVFGCSDMNRVEAKPYNLVLFDKIGQFVEIKNESSQSMRLVLVAGQPINEPICQDGPFVMNTPEEIKQAYEDVQSYKNGFENARIWRSEGINRWDKKKEA